MRTEHKIESVRRLLDGEGQIAEPGYALQPYWIYDRADIRAPKIRIKEWDCYIVNDGAKCLMTTLADCGYIGLIGVTWIDWATLERVELSAVAPFPMGKWALPSSAESGRVSRSIGRNTLTFETADGVRKLTGSFADKRRELSFSLTLSDAPRDNMVIATPLDKRGHFYYNQKINLMRTEGSAVLNGSPYAFSPDRALATLDWGRGVWTYDNTWLWSSLNAVLPDGTLFGWNLGGGFGDTSAASENMLFTDGIAHKIGEVTFEIPKKTVGEKKTADDYMSPWKITSDDGRLNAVFKPVYDRAVPINLGVVAMLPHQVFGVFGGTAVLDDGSFVKFENLFGFAEKVHNKW
ncbi:MAG: DUF2804 domain-containing protein [Clostridiales bacterium]|jgi:hypothetical protein|nr:DUF2804 domain-containing protein [Clostridiales bacterium]